MDFYKTKLFKKIGSKINDNKEDYFIKKRDAIDFLKETTK